MSKRFNDFFELGLNDRQCNVLDTLVFNTLVLPAVCMVSMGFAGFALLMTLSV